MQPRTAPSGDPGRRLSGVTPPDPRAATAALDEAALRAGLPPGPWALSVVAETESTNADLRAAAAAGARPGHVLVAEFQRAGRGRLGRSWESPPGTGLTFSVLMRPEGVPLDRWGWLPLAAGVALAEAVEAVAGVPAALKWPNDVLAADGGKLAGVLVERVDTPDGPAAVVGVGLNVSTERVHLPVPTATSLLLAGARDLDRGRLLAATLGSLARWFEAWHAVGGDAEACGLRAAYRAASATLGSDVVVELPDGTVVGGHAEDVGADGSLQLGTRAGGRAIAAGDVTHVR
jgi:BirA family biotin operon repressor/biotin-[acetyl-CoA-carboxylase] ligase